MGLAVHHVPLLLLAVCAVGCNPVPRANASAPIPVKAIDTPCVVVTAAQEVGVKEVGKNSGRRVKQYLASTKLGPGYPWCAAFVHWTHAQCGVTLKPEREFAAAARFAREREVFRKGQLHLYEGDDLGHPYTRISEDGDCFTLYYQKLGRVGHVGLVAGEDEEYLTTIEGNTSDGGSRDGDGVYRRKRKKSSICTINSWSE